MVACSAFNHATPPSVECPDCKCNGKTGNNYGYIDPHTYYVNKNYFMQCVGGKAYWPTTLEFNEGFNQCLYKHNDECVTTKPWHLVPTFECPDICVGKGSTLETLLIQTTFDNIMLLVSTVSLLIVLYAQETWNSTNPTMLSCSKEKSVFTLLSIDL